MTGDTLLELVDRGDFRGLFIARLGWNNPDTPTLTVEADGQQYTLHGVASYRGLRIWVCPTLPHKRVQRKIDTLVGKDNLERLVIFAGTDRQEWRWPRRAQTSGVNAKLLMHRHEIGKPDPHLANQLQAIQIDFDAGVTLVELLSRMRAAFDVESESASVQAARLMGVLYEELDAANVKPNDATLLLARLLFLLFGDDGGMWTKDLFESFLVQHTTDETLHDDLIGLFFALNTEEARRDLPAESPLRRFRYVNGGLFRDPLTLQPLTPTFRATLRSACEFDWQVISPAVFGSMFQTVRDKEARRPGGEHYTTEENILKTIGPLFLDDYRNRLQAAWDDKGQLTRLHNDLGKLRFMDPACGCGNFLVVAYRELRALELELLKRRRDLDDADQVRGSGRNLSQLTLDVTRQIKVTLNHFYGIEIAEWPARIAETAMLLVDHLANQRMEEDFGAAPDRLPIRLAPKITHGNALRLDWNSLLPRDECSYIFGNPPFVGKKGRTPDQRDDQQLIFSNAPGTGDLDYVTAWYEKSLDYIRNTSMRVAFVSTNSITQGEQVPALWSRMLGGGADIGFAHRTFAWTSEAKDTAVVHCVIIGYSHGAWLGPKAIYEYADLKAEPTIVPASRINPYLLDAPVVIVPGRRQALGAVPRADFGSMPNDQGNLLLTLAEAEDIRTADPVATGYIRRFASARELLRGVPKFCLWLEGVTQAEIQSSPVLRNRIEAVAAKRSGSPRAATLALAKTPHLFGERRQPAERYLCVPRHAGEGRSLIPMMFFEPSVIAGDTTVTIGGADLYLFGLLQSATFAVWQETVGGRIKSDLRFSIENVYNTFPFPSPTAGNRQAVAKAAQAVLDVRDAHVGVPLDDLYDPVSVPSDLREAHRRLDAAVDLVFGRSAGFANDEERLVTLFEHYEAATQTLAPAPATDKPKRPRRLRGS